jgi:hypothetical protein
MGPGVCAMITNEADANLIAAAPDLLAACRAACPYISAMIGEGPVENDSQYGDRLALNLINAAIDKAEGRQP